MPRWITWKMQPELAKRIRDTVDTGCARDILVQQICEENTQYTKDEVGTELDRLVSLCLLVDHHGYVKVTEWAHSAVMDAFALSSWTQCLQALKARGIWHSDMITYGLVSREEAPQ